ncbi:hypothetical protein N752_25775 [Desulforamulus aquiferis]|nr:hypothetical protein [Desulforamulus aquiferis]RYD02224.1 hypothetical protein N752_25775 [Desulforamulus aquiferis]
MTNWGFFKFHWLTVKWVITVGTILFGTFWLGPWVNGMTSIADLERSGAFDNPTFLHFRNMNAWFGSTQALLLVLTVFISVFKPGASGEKVSNCIMYYMLIIVQ